MIRFRPLEAMDAQSLNSSRRRSPFSASWSATMHTLTRELAWLGASDAVIAIAADESDIRIDGTFPKANARVRVPTVVVAFTSRDHGALKYTADEFDRWQDNVRAIALGLESLRRVDRYGITKRGEQYAGWRALPAGDGADVERGQAIIAEQGSVAAALRATHPDRGGDVADFHAVQAARQAASSVR